MVIPKDKDMDDLLKIIVYSMNTCDNKADSATFIKKHIQRLKFKSKDHHKVGLDGINLHFEDEDDQCKLTEEELYSIYRTTLMKYKLIRIRCKISYLAFAQKMIISEFLLSKLVDSYIQLVKNDEFPMKKMDEYGIDTEIYEKLFSNNIGSFLKVVMDINV